MTRTRKPNALLVAALAVLAVAAWSTVQAQDAGSEPGKKPAPESTAPASNETGNQTEPEPVHGHGDCHDHGGPKGPPAPEAPKVTLHMGPDYQQKKIGPGETVWFELKLFADASQPVAVVFKTVASDGSGIVGSWSHKLASEKMELDGYGFQKISLTSPLVPSPSATVYKVTVLATVVDAPEAQAKATVVASLT